MKKLHILFVLLPGFCFAQGRFSIGISGSADYCYRSLSDDFPVRSVLEEKEIPGIGYTIGIKAKMNMGSAFSVQSGLNYVHHRYGSKKEQLVFLSLMPDDPGVPAKMDYSKIFKYLQIPLTVSWYKGRALKFGVTAGSALNIFLPGETELNLSYPGYTSQQSSISEKDAGKVTLAGIIGTGMEYSRNRIAVRFELTLNIRLFNMNFDSGLRLWSVGANVGLYYQLGKATP